MRFSVIVCAHNEAQHLPGCLHSLLAQSCTPDEILVINNASTDATRAVAEAVPRVRVVDEPREGLVVARETGRLHATGDVLVYVDADCRAPLTWLARIERRWPRSPPGTPSLLKRSRARCDAHNPSSWKCRDII